MSKTVFILGAGSSAVAGAPMMNNFLDKAEELMSKNFIDMKLKDFEDDFKRVFETIWHLRKSVYEKSKLKLDNIEEVLSVFEMGKTINCVPGIDSQDDLEQLLTSTRRLIFKTLQETIEFPYVKDHFIPLADVVYEKLAKLLMNLKNTAIRDSLNLYGCSVITFNYDLVIDHSLNHCMIFAKEEEYKDMKFEIDYGLRFSGDRYYTLSPPHKIPLLKLHGSLNWVRCNECKQVFVYDLNDKLMIDIFRTGTMRAIDRGRDRFTVPLYEILSRMSEGKKCSGCNTDLKFVEPFIVPPVWNKTEYHQTLANVWNQAATELSEAENIFVSGYSLPESDHFFRYLYSLGTIGEARLKRFWVFDIDDTGEVEDRFRRLVGEGIKNRFRYFQKPFDEAVDVIADELGISFT